VVHRQRVLDFLASTSRSLLPWVLTTHRIEDIPRRATHLAIIEAGRLLYRGRLNAAGLRRAFSASDGGGAAAPLRRWVPRVTDPGRALVTLRAADIYVEGHAVLHEINLTIRQGDCWIVHGGNGAGKSTLLRTIYGDHPVATGGSIHRDGIEPGVPLADFRAWVGFIAPQLQTDHPQYLEVVEAVGSGLHSSIGLNEPLTSAERRRARAALADFGLRRLGGRTLRELSYGQLRRVLFARAWVARPRMLLLDEPFAGVDTPTRRALLARIEALLHAGLTLVIATHHRAEWPRGATHELELAGGRVLYCGPVRR
jgi:molybdate transport system ATP-binding protein